MDQQMLTIQQAARYLGVSTKTLTRWEQRGVLIPERTYGNQRRYSITDLETFKEKTKNASLPPTVDQVESSGVTVVSPVETAPLQTTVQQASVPDQNPVLIPPEVKETFADRLRTADLALGGNFNISSPGIIKPKANTIASPEDGLPVKNQFLYPSLSPENTKRTYTFAAIVSAIVFFVFGGLVLGTTSGLLLPNLFGNPVDSAPVAGKAVQTGYVSIPASGSAKLNADLQVNIPAIFTGKVNLKNDFVVDGKSLFNDDIKVNNKNVDLGTGELTASNVVYSLIAGANVTITGDPQNPTIAAAVEIPDLATSTVTSLQGQTGPLTISEGSGIGLNGLKITNTGVLSVGGQTGEVALAGSTGISVSGTTITNTDTGSAQNIFKTIVVGSDAFSASSNTDSLTFEAGTGIFITSDTSNKKLTFTNTGGAGGWSDTGSLLTLSNSTDNITIGNNSDLAKVSIVGDTDEIQLLVRGNGTQTNNIFAVQNSLGTNVFVINSSGQIISGSSPVTLTTTTGNLDADAIGLIASDGAGNNSSGSGLETDTDRLGLLQGCANGQLLKWNDVSAIWECSNDAGATSSVINIENNELAIGANVDTIDFSTDFAVNASPATEANVSIADDILNFTELADSLTLDAATGINLGDFDLTLGGSNGIGSVIVAPNAGGKAALIVNKQGTDDIFSASASGTTRFTITNAGNLQFSGNTSFVNTITSAATGNQTYTLPDASGTICLSTGNCAGAGSSITGSGTATQLAFFSGGAQNIASDSNLYWDNTSKLLGIGNPSPVARLDVAGNVTGKALTILNETGDQDIFTASASGTTAFTVARTGNVTLSSTTPNSDRLAFIPQSGGAATFTGTLTSLDLTGNQTYTLPNATGTICLTSGNCAGIGGNGDITAVGSMASGDAFSDSTADDDWLGLGTTAGRIEFDDQVLDEINILAAKLGLGTQTPDALLHVTGAVTGKALTIFDETGNQDILTASASGATRLALDRTGNLNIIGGEYRIGGNSVLNATTLGPNVTTSSLQTVGTIGTGTWQASAIGTAYGGTGDDTSGVTGVPYISTGNWLYEAALDETRGGTGLSAYALGDILYGSGVNTLAKLSIGTEGRILTISGGLPAWTDPGGTLNFWQKNNGALAPLSVSDDLLLGGTSTASARFAFTNNTGSGTPTASIAGTVTNLATYLTGNGNLGTTNAQTLTIGTGSTGNVLLAPGGTSALTALANGNIGINTGAPGEKLHVNGNLRIEGSNAVILNTNGTLRYDSTTDFGNGFTGGIVLSGSSAENVVLNTSGAGPILFRTNSTTRGMFDSTGRFGIGTTSPLATLDVRGLSGTTPVASISGQTTNASLIVDNSGSGDLFTASSSGLNRFVIKQNGNVGIGTTNPASTLTVAGDIAAKSIGSVRYADQFPGADIGAKINAADSDIGSGNAGIIIVPPGNYTASTLITIGKNHTLQIQGNGTFNTAGIRFSDSTTDTSGTGALICSDRATIKLSNGANTDVISQTNFASLTTTGNLYGVFRTTIENCIIDGNSANNTSGYGIRLFGRAVVLDNVTVQNAEQDGIWTEGNQDSSFTDYTADLESSAKNIRLIKNGGNGWTFKGPNDSVISDLAGWGNGGWGLDVFQSLHVDNVNVYLNGSGGIKVESTAAIQGSGVSATNDTGWGLLIDTGAGNSNLAGSTAACNGCIAIEFRAPNQTFQGSVVNSSTGIKFNGGGANLQLTMSANTTWFDCTNENGQVIIDVSAVDGTGTVKGPSCWTGSEFIRFSNAGGLNPQFQIPVRDITAGGYTYTLPTINGTLASTNGAQSFAGLQTFNGGLSIASGQNLTLSGFTQGSIPFIGASGVITENNSSLFWNNTTNRLGLGTTSPLATLDIRGLSGTTPVASFSGQTSVAALVVENNGSGDLLAASKSGITQFVISNNGNLGLGVRPEERGVQLGDFPNVDYATPRYISIADYSTLSGNGTASLVGNWTSPTLWGIGAATNTSDYTLRIGTTNDTIGSRNTWANDQSLRLLVGGALGNSALATLDVREVANTIPTASFSARSTFATMVVDNASSGDLFTASKSGATKFTILNNGNIQLNNYTTNGGILYTNGSGIVSQMGAGALGQCLTSAGGGTPNWTTCAAGMNLWQSNNGTVSPFSDTLDLLVGGTSTASAKFAFINNTGSGTPVASISAQTGVNSALVLGSNSSIQSVKKQTFTLGGDTTGDIQFKPGNSTTSLFLGSNGNVGIGAVNDQVFKLLVNASGYGVGQTDGINTISLWAGNSGTIGNSGQLGTSTNSPLGFFTNNATPQMVLSTAGSLGIGTGASPFATLEVRGNSGITPIASFSGQTSLAGMIVDNSGFGDLFTASKSGATKFTVLNSGNIRMANYNTAGGVFYGQADGTLGLSGSGTVGYCLVANGSGAPGWASCGPTGLWNIANGLLHNGNTTADVAIGGVSSASAKFLVSMSGTNPTASISANTAKAGLIVDNRGAGDLFSASSSGLNRFVIKQNGNVGIGTTTPLAKLDISAVGSGVENVASFLGDGDSSTDTTITLGGTNGGVGEKYVTYRNADTGTGAWMSGMDDDETFGWYFGIAGEMVSNNLFMKLDQSGNLGIGPNTPLAKLDVQGPTTGDVVRFTSTSDINDYLAFGVHRDGNTYSDIAAISDTGFSDLVLQRSGGNVGIGTTDPLAHLDVRGIFNHTPVAYIGGANAKASLVVDNSGAGDLFTASKSGATKFVINNEGNVGIGTQTPNLGKLHMLREDTTTENGIYFQTMSDADWKIYQPTSSGDLRLWTDTGNSDKFTFQTNGRLGIGTTSSQATLDVRGQNGTLPVASVSGRTSFAALIADNNGVGDLFAASKSGATKFVVKNNGDVQIANLANCPAIQTDASGNLVCGGTGDTASFTDNTTESMSDSNTDVWDGTQPNMTPRTSSNTLLVSVNVFVHDTTDTDYEDDVFTIRRSTSGSNATCSDTQVGNKFVANTDADIPTTFSNATATFLDSPATTNQVRYTVCSDTDSSSDEGSGAVDNIVENIVFSIVQLGADLAENYYTTDDSLEPGHIVNMDSRLPAGVKKSTRAYDSEVLGIYSTAPGKVLDDRIGDGFGRPVPIALSGRVPVKVSTASGEIKPGDYITASSVPGVGMKATQGGRVVGQALTGFSGEGIGAVLVFVNNSWIEPPLSLNEDGNISYNGVSYGTGSIKTALESIKSIAAAMSQDGIASTSARVTELETKQATHSAQISKLEDKTASLEAKIRSLEDAVVIGANTVGISPDTSQDVPGFNELSFNDQVATSSSVTALKSHLMTMQERLALLELQASGSALLGGFTASTSAELGLEKLEVKDLTINNTLSVVGRTLLSDVGITGTANIGLLSINGLDDTCTSETQEDCIAATINTMNGPLKLQSNGLNGLDILNGKVTIDTKGNFVTEGEVTASKVNVSAKDIKGASLGEGILKAGQSKVIIKTTAVNKDSAVFITPKTKTSLPLSVTEQKDGESFTIEIESNSTKDIKFNWWIVN